MNTRPGQKLSAEKRYLRTSRQTKVTRLQSRKYKWLNEALRLMCFPIRAIVRSVSFGGF